jgi:hypothetical protein
MERKKLRAEELMENVGETGLGELTAITNFCKRMAFVYGCAPAHAEDVFKVALAIYCLQEKEYMPDVLAGIVMGDAEVQAKAIEDFKPIYEQYDMVIQSEQYHMAMEYVSLTMRLMLASRGGFQEGEFNA